MFTNTVLVGLEHANLDRARCQTVRVKYTMYGDDDLLRAMTHHIRFHTTLFYVYCREYHRQYADRPILFELLRDGYSGTLEEEPDEC